VARLSKKKAVAKKSIAAKKPLAKIRKKRVGNVRELILKALASGAKTRSALLKSSGASYNALVMHLSKLREESIVVTDAGNRLISLVASPAPVVEATVVTAKRKSPAKAAETPAASLPQLASATALVAGYSPRVLNEALDALAVRFKPISALDEKLLVLDQLTTQIGGPIGHVLASIKTDLLRFSES
jgi:hypothetical protein